MQEYSSVYFSELCCLLESGVIFSIYLGSFAKE